MNWRSTHRQHIHSVHSLQVISMTERSQYVGGRYHQQHCRCFLKTLSSGRNRTDDNGCLAPNNIQTDKTISKISKTISFSKVFWLECFTRIYFTTHPALYHIKITTQQITTAQCTQWKLLQSMRKTPILLISASNVNSVRAMWEVKQH